MLNYLIYNVFTLCKLHVRSGLSRSFNFTSRWHVDRSRLQPKNWPDELRKLANDGIVWTRAWRDRRFAPHSFSCSNIFCALHWTSRIFKLQRRLKAVETAIMHLCSGVYDVHSFKYAELNRFLDKKSYRQTLLRRTTFFLNFFAENTIIRGNFNNIKHEFSI